jgi:hypothetical protein
MASDDAYVLSLLRDRLRALESQLLVMRANEPRDSAVRAQPSLAPSTRAAPIKAAPAVAKPATRHKVPVAHRNGVDPGQWMPRGHRGEQVPTSQEFRLGVLAQADLPEERAALRRVRASAWRDRLPMDLEEPTWKRAWLTGVGD